ncbi:MAG: UDP-N-acetylmuramoyl-L-alanine--D-glutamate ligase [Acidobacteria bacterium]|nr:MAG: UDP-N-acetylmuramoyl-L-alanine--D-glutamate ligase [Acidobacteriota bacterium]
MSTLIVGYGRSGKAVADYLSAANRPFEVFDEGQVGDTDLKVHSILDSIMWSSIERVVVSPGIASDHQLLKKAESLGKEIISEIEFAYQNCEGPVVAVTGSNGKSSTVTMLESIFKAAGRDVQLCGNIGKPFTRAVIENSKAIFVVEISSFQLETVSTFKPKVALLLNVTPDHLDRHGSFEAYEQAKLKLFRNQEKGDMALVPTGYLRKVPGKARVLEVPGDAGRIENSCVFLGTAELSRIDNPVLRSPHQRLNSLFAALAALEMGVSIDRIQSGLNAFPGLKHRMEVVGQFQGVTWINDSKATNTDSTQVALKAMTTPYILILGGKNKDADFSVLDFSNGEPEKLILYGQAADEIGEALRSMKPEIHRDFKEAVLKAWSDSSPGQVILLSPGCASFDQFGNFELRGEAFRDLFKEVSSGGLSV